MLVVFAKLFLMLLSAKAASGYCSNSTLYAEKYTQYKTVIYSNYDDCTIYIRPTPSLNSSNSYYRIGPGEYSVFGYYLQISWPKFEVNGDMPDCSNDSMEVFLSRPHGGFQTIGKYCSNNLKSRNLFNMYSYDGHAKIKIHADSKTRSRIAFTYILKSIRTQYLGTMSSYCRPYTSCSYSGNIYSSGWPNGYARSSSSCNHRIYAGPNVKTRVALMYVYMTAFLKTYPCEHMEYDLLLLTGSNHRSSTAYPISGKLCSGIRVYDSNYAYLNIEHIRVTGTLYDIRGFMAGYTIYEPVASGTYKPTYKPTYKHTYKPTYKPTYKVDDPSPTAWHRKRLVRYREKTRLAGLITGLIVGVIVLLLVIMISIWLCRRRSRDLVGRSDKPVSSNKSMLMTSTVQNNGTTTMSQTVTAPQYQYGNPVSYQQFQGPAPHPTPIYTVYLPQSMACQTHSLQTYPDSVFKPQEGNLSQTTAHGFSDQAPPPHYSQKIQSL